MKYLIAASYLFCGIAAAHYLWRMSKALAIQVFMTELSLSVIKLSE
jgi:hypothetical protein